MNERKEPLSALRLKRAELERSIEELASGARVMEMCDTGYRDVTDERMMELLTQMGRVAMQIREEMERVADPLRRPEPLPPAPPPRS